MFDRKAEVEFKVPAHLSYLADLRRLVERVGLQRGFPRKVIDPLKLATEEAVANIIKHGYGGKKGFIYMKIIVKKSSLTIKLLDQGLAFDPRQAATVDIMKHVAERRKGGLGIAMMRRLMDKIDYRQTDAGNELSLTKFAERHGNFRALRGIALAAVTGCLIMTCLLPPVSLLSVDEAAAATARSEQSRKSSQQRECYQHYSNGITLYQQRRFKQAIRQFDKALACYQAAPRPDREQIVECLKMKALQHRLLQNFPTAIAVFDEAIAQVAAAGLNDTNADADVRRLMAWTYYDAGQYPQAIDQFKRALRIFTRLVNPNLQAQCGYGLGLSYLAGEDFETAESYFQQARKLYVQLRDDDQRLDCTFHIGQCQFMKEDYDRALASLSSYLEAGADPAKKANCHFWSASIHLARKQYAMALPALRAADSLAQQMSDEGFQADCNYNIGICHFNLEEWDSAAPALQEAARLYRSVRDYERVIITLETIGHARFNSARYPAAIDAYREAATVASQHGYPLQEAQILVSLGDALEKLDSLDEAVTAYATAASKYESLNQVGEAIRAYIRQGDILSQLGQLESAIVTYRRARRLAARAPEHRRLQAVSSYKTGEVLRSSERCEEALPEYERALSIYGELSVSGDTLALCQDALGHCNYDFKRYAEAAHHFSQAAGTYSSAGDTLAAANAYYNAGSSYTNLERYRMARDHYQDAITLYDEVDDARSTADAHTGIASVYFELESRDLALQHYRDALKIYRRESDRSGIARCYAGMAKIHHKLPPKDPGQAEELYLQARDLFANIDSTQWAACSRGLALVHFDQERWRLALQESRHAGEVFERHEQPERAAPCFRNAGSAAYNLADYNLARTFYERALNYYRTNDEYDRAAELYKFIGQTYLDLFEPDQAWRNYENGLEIYQRLGNAKGVFDCSIGLGDVHFERGNYLLASSRYEEALNKAQLAGLSGLDLEADANSRLFEVDDVLGRDEHALRRLRRNIDIYKQLGMRAKQLRATIRLGEYFFRKDRYEEALDSFEQVHMNADHDSLARFRRAALIHKGNVYEEVGSEDQAEIHYQKALTLAQAASDQDHVSASLTGLGNVLLRQEKYAQAEERFQEVLRLAEEQDESLDMARALLNLGNVYSGWQQLARAHDHYLRSREISEGEKFTEGVAVAFNNLGIIDLRRGSNQTALDNFRRAAGKAEQIRLKRLQITAYSNQGVTYENMARYDSARIAYERAVALVDEIRESFKRKDDLFLSFVESTSELYDRLIALLSESGDDSTAYQYVERFVSRDLNLFDMFKDKAKASGDRQLIDYLNRLESARYKWDANNRLVENYRKNQPQRPVPDELVRILAQNAAEVDSLEQVLLKKYREFPGHVEILPGRITQTQYRIPRDAMVVTYYASKEKLYVFIASADRHVARSVDISRRELYKKIDLYRKTVVEQREMAIKTGWNLEVNSWQDERVLPLTRITTELHRYLILPFERDFKEAETLILMPTGKLSYLPLQALARQSDDGGLRFVIEEWNVAYITSATFTNSIISRPQPASEPCYENVYAIGYASGNPPLPGVAREMASLRQIWPSARTFEGRNATVERAVAASRKSCVLVVSSHVELNQANPNRTCFELGDGEWCIGDIIADIKPGHFTKMNLAIFPNCETALGEEDPRFSVHNFVYAFCQKGAASVMATLWQVSDYFTPYLMEEFYHNLFQEKMDKAQSLRHAQLAMLENPRHRHPFLWAAFLLYGYWLEDVVEVTQK